MGINYFDPSLELFNEIEFMNAPAHSAHVAWPMAVAFDANQCRGVMDTAVFSANMVAWKSLAASDQRRKHGTSCFHAWRSTLCMRT